MKARGRSGVTRKIGHARVISADAAGPPEPRERSAWNGTSGRLSCSPVMVRQAIMPRTFLCRASQARVTRYLPDIDVHARSARKSSIGSQKIKFPPYSEIFARLRRCRLSPGEELQHKKEGSFDAYRTSCAVDRGHPAQALWRHRAGGVLADGGTDRARPRGDAVCQRRFGDVGASSKRCGRARCGSTARCAIPTRCT